MEIAHAVEKNGADISKALLKSSSSPVEHLQATKSVRHDRTSGARIRYVLRMHHNSQATDDIFSYLFSEEKRRWTGRRIYIIKKQKRQGKKTAAKKRGARETWSTCPPGANSAVGWYICGAPGRSAPHCRRLLTSLKERAGKARRGRGQAVPSLLPRCFSSSVASHFLHPISNPGPTCKKQREERRRRRRYIDR